MRFVRVQRQDGRWFGRLSTDTTVRLWSAAPWAGGVELDRTVPFVAAEAMVPVEPTKIVCVGRNYRAHAAELGNEMPREPLLFFKPPSALASSGEPIRLPSASERVEHESELAVVMGAKLCDGRPDDALAAVFGYAAANDVTARDLQKRDGQWARAKGFDSFCPLGPWIETELALEQTEVRAVVNGELRQHGFVRDMAFPVADLVAYISRIMTLEPGDVVLTGTPEGVGPLRAGDVVEVSVSGIGSIRNPVAAR
ncbi:MAG: fumarylacetoacetate hydrolase family protein [Deltaproteobacteria bacterium]|nr:fumarylacetoacetate hydrolase family protein [Deltaproteobacteria bacterium]